jgi:hypothetical protein
MSGVGKESGIETNRVALMERAGFNAEVAEFTEKSEPPLENKSN